MDEHAFPPTGFAVARIGCSLQEQANLWSVKFSLWHYQHFQCLLYPKPWVRLLAQLLLLSGKIQRQHYVSRAISDTFSYFSSSGPEFSPFSERKELDVLERWYPAPETLSDGASLRQRGALKSTTVRRLVIIKDFRFRFRGFEKAKTVCFTFLMELEKLTYRISFGECQIS